MAEAGLVKMENHLEKFFKPSVATAGEYDFEVLPRQTKTRRQRIVLGQAVHRNLCRRVKVDTETSFNLLFSDLKTVMKKATPAQWDDLKERVLIANELFWKIGAELRIPSKVTEAAEFMRMSKLINTIANYMDDHQVKFGTPEKPNSADNTFRNLQMLMQVGVTYLPHSEVMKIISSLFDMIQHCGKPFVMKHTVDKSGREALVIAPAPSPTRRDRIVDIIAEANRATVEHFQIEPERLKSDIASAPQPSRQNKLVQIFDMLDEPNLQKSDIDNICNLIDELKLSEPKPKPFKSTRMIFGSTKSNRSHLRRYDSGYVDDCVDFIDSCLN